MCLIQIQFKLYFIENISKSLIYFIYYHYYYLIWESKQSRERNTPLPSDGNYELLAIFFSFFFFFLK